MFGSLTSDFEPYVSPSSVSHEKYKLSPKYGSIGSSSQDKGGRNNSYAGSGQNKRGPNSHWDASKSKRGGHSGHMAEARTSYVSPQEVLRRSRGNNNNNNNNRRGRAGYQNQSFRGNQGQGRRPYQYTKRK